MELFDAVMYRDLAIGKDCLERELIHFGLRLTGLGQSQPILTKQRHSQLRRSSGSLR